MRCIKTTFGNLKIGDRFTSVGTAQYFRRENNTTANEVLRPLLNSIGEEDKCWYYFADDREVYLLILDRDLIEVEFASVKDGEEFLYCDKWFVKISSDLCFNGHKINARDRDDNEIRIFDNDNTVKIKCSPNTFGSLKPGDQFKWHGIEFFKSFWLDRPDHAVVENTGEILTFPNHFVVEPIN